MNITCLPDYVINDIKDALSKNSGTLLRDMTENMTSKQRMDTWLKLTKGSKEDANFIALRFERALASKQSNALKMFLDKALNPKEKKTKEYSQAIKKIEEAERRGLLEPDEAGNYLETLLGDMFKSKISKEEIVEISRLSEKYKKLEEKVEMDPNNQKLVEEYSMAMLEARDYVYSLKPSTKAEFWSDLYNLPKTVMSTMDFSAPFRQGFGMIGRKNFWLNIKPMMEFAFKPESYDKLRAAILNDKDYGFAKDARLRLSVLAEKLSQREDAYMSRLLGKVPGLKVVMSASERAYTGFLSKLRFDEFKRMKRLAELNGEDVRLGSQTLKDIAKVVNDFTGSGDIGAGDKYSTAVPFLNNVFFAPRKISGTINIFNPKTYFDPNVSKIVRIEAAKNLIGMLGASATLLTLYNTLIADEDEKRDALDPKSANFGKLVAGNTRIDVTGGNATYITLLARLLSGKSTNSITGDVTELGGKYGSNTKLDVVTDFGMNKLGPIPNLLANLLDNAEWKTDEDPVARQTIELFLPMILTSIYDAYEEDEGAGKIMLTTLAELFGFGVNIYGDK